MPVTTNRTRAAIVGPGNIGTDLLAKLRRSDTIEVAHVVGVVESDGLEIAREYGAEVSAGVWSGCCVRIRSRNSCSTRRRRKRT